VLITPYGTIALRAPRIFVSSRKLGTTHQNVLIFFKGDPKKIKSWGTPEFGEMIEDNNGE